MSQNRTDFIIKGGQKLSGEITTNFSKNGGVALLCASLLNKNKTHLKGIEKIEDVMRLFEIMRSIGVSVEENGDEVMITPPEKFSTENLIDSEFSKIRSGIMLIPPIARANGEFFIGTPGGCLMGERTIIAHKNGLGNLGIDISTEKDGLRIKKSENIKDEIVMYESGDTATVNVILAAATIPKVTKIYFASANYQVQEVCHFLEKLGVKIEDIGQQTIIVHGVKEISKEIEYTNSEDPIESMTFISAAITTNSKLTIKRAPIEFLLLELLTLENMGLSYSLSEKYLSANGKTKLVDITINESDLVCSKNKIHSTPYPGLNVDNLPFFIPIATKASGTTLIHDWMWENRAIYYTELNRLGAKIKLLGPHRTIVEGKKELHAGKILSPPALRPAVVILIAMLSAKGTSVLQDSYPINRGYKDVAERFNGIGADISTVNLREEG